MSYLRRFADYPREVGKHTPEFIARLESCSVVKGDVPIGVAADPLHKHPMDQFYYVLEGELGVQLGSERITAMPDTLIRVPADTPHYAFNDGDIEVNQVELVVPSPPPAKAGEMLKLVELVDETGESAPEGCVKPVAEDGWKQLAAGMESQLLANKATGSQDALVAAVRQQPAPDGFEPGYHLHEFDELLFVLEGSLVVDVAGERYNPGKHELVVMPARVPHRAWNAGPGVERHITVLAAHPSSPNMADWTVNVDFSIATA